MPSPPGTMGCSRRPTPPCHRRRTLVTMVFATLGFLSPANRGGLMTAVLLLFVFMGCFAGYSSARLYKTFKVGWSSWCLGHTPPSLRCAPMVDGLLCSPAIRFP